MDFFEEYVKDVALGMDEWEFKNGKKFDCTLDEKTLKKIADKLKEDKLVNNYLCEIDGICIDYIIDELGLVQEDIFE